MTTKNYIKFTFISLLACFSLMPLGGNMGGYGGHHFKFLAVTIIYFGLTIYFLTKTKSRKEQLLLLLILILPPSILYLPIHIKHFEETQVAFISTLGHFIGIAFGIMAHFAKYKVKIILGTLLLTGSLWITFIGFPLWLHKATYGTFTGNVNYDMPAHITGQNQYGQNLSDIDFKNKFILLDFWNTGCGVCFQKFPQVQEIYDTYKMDTSILILAINKPLKRDSTGQAFAVMNKKGYSFPILLPSVDTLPELFNVRGYPTTFLIDKSGKVIFRGDIENAKTILAKLKKNEM